LLHHGKAGEKTIKCAACMELEASYARKHYKRKRKEDDDEEDYQVDSDAPTITLGAFFADISCRADLDSPEDGSDLQLSARVECDDDNILKWQGEARAKNITALIEQNTQWHWSYVTMLCNQICSLTDRCPGSKISMHVRK
jgi:hypothetical protein